MFHLARLCRTVFIPRAARSHTRLYVEKISAGGGHIEWDSCASSCKVMGAWLSSLGDCLWREETAERQPPRLLEHYHKIHKDMCDLESLLEQRAKAARCC